MKHPRQNIDTRANVYLGVPSGNNLKININR